MRSIGGITHRVEKVVWLNTSFPKSKSIIFGMLMELNTRSKTVVLSEANLRVYVVCLRVGEGLSLQF